MGLPAHNAGFGTEDSQGRFVTGGIMANGRGWLRHGKRLRSALSFPIDEDQSVERAAHTHGH